MAKLKIEFSPDIIGKTIADLSWDWCKKISNNEDVSTNSSTLTERGCGIYILENPNITEDTDFKISILNSIDNYATGIFSLADGNIAQQSTVDLLRKIQTNKAVIAPDDLSVNIYDDDGVTPLLTFTVSVDKRTRTP